MKNCLVTDLDRCSGCDSCVAACKFENDIDLGMYYRRVPAVGPTGTFPNIEMYWLPFQCQQCANPGCIEVCPTGASYRDEATGVVLIDEEKCIGCETCLTGCPYQVRTLNPTTNIVEKCTLCFQRSGDENWVPACVRTCCTGAILFGDLDDPESTVSKAVAAAGAANCHQIADANGVLPSSIYILSEKTAKWQDDPEGLVRYGVTRQTTQV
ncbi:MAG: 4Fe-4S dicluster domain-containing protein [Actinobacteria bacterium]|nr:4Fe-4S dicluster domain-containing protein [Actinomycetota bacterium]